MLFAINRWEEKDQVLQWLRQGTNVVCDRYAYSGVAYTAAKGIDFEWCKNGDKGLLKPDLVIDIDVSVDTIKQRGGFGEERYEKIEF
mmetsp:Transcript_67105/g.92821  ORF Transcript_67105/g.92821 Transcript_67105/m.92821 type:complete len:87 (+) Transcript_67105:132-392(+)